MISTWRNFLSRGACFSAMGITTRREKFSGSPTWRALWSGLPPNPDDFYHGALAPRTRRSDAEGRRAHYGGRPWRITK